MRRRGEYRAVTRDKKTTIHRHSTRSSMKNRTLKPCLNASGKGGEERGRRIHF